ncbi:hypothetical protein [Glaciecola sp. 33A]|jgi:hypothetical protein|uniref:hypothetical protein n=1 Tax=Glaciecola sp. 33A TaxID=2057807 RepID=UPI000C3456BC|nr:hypothetical protein [Glaciecola sp. 33A]PKI00876.1 hypothetical protein CXF81_13160 [Glaciecola sp. 33A]
MKNKLEKTTQLTQVQQLVVFGGKPLNIGLGYVGQPLNQRRMGFLGDHGLTTITDGRIPMPFVWNEKRPKDD